MNKKLIVALDFDSAELALNFLENLDQQKCLVKVGLELFISEGWKVLDIISEKGFEIFLDLKLHDIPNTVQILLERFPILMLLLLQFISMVAKI